MKEKTEKKIEKHRNQMMQNLFGDQSEDEDNEENEENEEDDYVLESNRHSNYLSDEGDGVQEPVGGREAYMKGQGEGELDSEGDMNDFEQQQPIYSENDQEQGSHVEGGEQHEYNEVRETDSESRVEYAQDVVTSRRRDAGDSGSEDHNFVDQDHDEVEQRRSPGSAEDERDRSFTPSPVAEIRDVFGDSDDEEPEYAAQNDTEREPISHFANEEEQGYEKNFGLDDDDAGYDSEEENVDVESKDKPAGPALELGIPLRQPPADPEKMNIIRLSNIMGIDSKPFDPKTYVEEDVFVTDESGTKKRIRLENNIVRWRSVKRPDGTISVESNARFVRWSDGSLQLLIGNEVLDTSIQDAHHDHTHLFLRHGKGILQCQGRLLKKMRFMPSSLSSNSHRLLTALVDSRHKKVYKVKNCVTDVDPEREKELKLKVESQTIRANMLLRQKREKVNRKYSRSVDRGGQLSAGYLEDARDEEDEYEARGRASRHHFEVDMAEAQDETRIVNAKKARGLNIPRSSSMTASKLSKRPAEFYESEREESEYETDGEVEELSPINNRHEDSEPEYVDTEQEEEEEGEEEAREVEASDEEEEELQPSAKGPVPSRKRKEIESDEDSPPRKAPAHRRTAVIYDSDDE